MKTTDTPSLSRTSAGFTLVEMIGVMAIIAILATVMVPNALRMIERAAVRAEADTLHSLGEQVALYLRDNRLLPTPGNGNWNNQLATYATLNANDILFNKRQTVITRLYVPDPIAANQRVMLFSSMRRGVALASYANIQANFSAIWNAQDGTVPPGAGWGGWSTVPAPGNIEYLVIERVNLAAVYRTDLLPYSITLNQLGAGTVSYWVTWANGAAPTFGTLTNATTPTVTLTLVSRDRVNLYSDAAGTVLKYTYVVSNSPKTFDYTTGWFPQ